MFSEQIRGLSFLSNRVNYTNYENIFRLNKSDSRWMHRTTGRTWEVNMLANAIPLML